MRIRDLVNRSLLYYWRSHLAVIAGVAVAVAVLAGALLVGASVRASLRQLVVNRLGATDEVIAAPGFFRTQLASELQTQGAFSGTYEGAIPLISIEGIVTHDENRRRAGAVQIYGISDTFFAFHGQSGVSVPSGESVLISPGLAAELGAAPGEHLLLRIEKPSAIPVESLHGRKEDLGITLRTTVDSVLPVDSLGEFSLRPQQTAVRAVFLPLQRLQRNLEQDGRANTILLTRRKSGAPNEASLAAARSALNAVVTLDDIGLRTRMLEVAGCLSLESASAVINDQTAQRARKAAELSGLEPSPVLTYLANALRIGERRIPYSLVTALAPPDYARLKGASPSKLEHPLLLNDWAARDLGAKPSQPISMDYYVWREEGQLGTASADFEVDAIIPLSGSANDRDYAPEYPGITEAKSLADWDPPFPVDLSLVRPRDEEYWERYRTTPKAFIALADGERLWRTRYGSLTSLRLFPKAGTDLKSAHATFVREMRASMDALAVGFSLYSARDQGLAASSGATDFGEYFTYFSFFIVASALLLAALFFRLGIEQRLREIGILKAIGFPSAAIRNLFLREAAVIAIVGSAIGAFGALLYAWFMIYGLRTWWVGAVGTTALRLHVSPWPLAIGVAGGILTAVICIGLTLRSLTSVTPRSLLSGSAVNSDGGVAPRRGSGLKSGRFRGSFALLVGAVAGIAGFGMLGAAGYRLIGEGAGFFGAGSLILIAILMFLTHWLRSEQGIRLGGHGWWAISKLGFRNAWFRPGRSVLCIALVGAATFIIVSVGAFRRDGSSDSFEPKSGTGGYELIGESLLPIVHNTNSEEGRESLNLGSSSKELAGVEFARFRLRPGDDASCLNLYQPRNPRILGASPEFIRGARFSFQSSLAASNEERENPWLLIAGSSAGEAVPVIADANSLTYALHLKVGDEMVISGDDGNALRLRVVGALSDSVLQGELIMSEENFVRHFPKEEGFRFFLIDVPSGKSESVLAFLEEHLSDFGFDVTETQSRLAGFHEVENTYLSTFQSLGGLGLLLGTIGLAAVLIRNVIERRRELALLRAVGYRSQHFAIMVIAENLFLLVAGLATGFTCAMIAVLPAFLGREGHFPVDAVLLLVLVMSTGLVSSVFAVLSLLRTPLLPALRGE